jgi:hypothetical protein
MVSVFYFWTSSFPRLSWRYPPLSLRIFPNVPGPLPRRPPRCIHSFLPSGHRPSPILQRVGAPQYPGQPLQSRGSFRGCSHFPCSGPPSLLATQVAPTATPFPGVGQPWLLLLGTPQFVTSPCSRYACRPNRAIDSGETCTPQDSQPCRLHRKT